MMMGADFCNTEGAKRLKAKIEDYWRDRGYNVDVKLVDAGFMTTMRSARTDVRSDMIGGLPRRRQNDDRRPPASAPHRAREFA